MELREEIDLKFSYAAPDLKQEFMDGYMAGVTDYQDILNGTGADYGDDVNHSLFIFENKIVGGENINSATPPYDMGFKYGWYAEKERHKGTKNNVNLSNLKP